MDPSVPAALAEELQAGAGRDAPYSDAELAAFARRLSVDPTRGIDSSSIQDRIDASGGPNEQKGIFEGLSASVGDVTVTVRRDGGQLSQVSPAALVVGDVVRLDAESCYCWADVVLLNGEVQVDQSNLTGETETVTLTQGKVVFSSVRIVGDSKPSPWGLVLAVGKNTFASAAAQALGDNEPSYPAHPADLAFQQAIAKELNILVRSVNQEWRAPHARSMAKALSAIVIEKSALVKNDRSEDLRAGVVEAVQKLQQRGVRVVMLTGDNKDRALSAAVRAGLLPASATVEDIMAGAEMREKFQKDGVNLDDDSEDGEKQKAAVRSLNLTVLARCTPKDKFVVVMSLLPDDDAAPQQNNSENDDETDDRPPLPPGQVWVLANGTNDAPAARLAAWSFATAEATDVAKECCDFCMLSDEPSALVQLVRLLELAEK
jgi:magnesium-transporting ATPase (P-type)